MNRKQIFLSLLDDHHLLAHAQALQKLICTNVVSLYFEHLRQRSECISTRVKLEVENAQVHVRPNALTIAIECSFVTCYGILIASKCTESDTHVHQIHCVVRI